MDDLISRQKAKDVIDMALDSIDHVPSWVYDKLLNALNEVPSVKPTHKTHSNTLDALDCVERQVVIDSFKKRLSKIPYMNNTFQQMIRRDEIIRCIQDLSDFPSADLSSYSDKLYALAYERGKADAQPRKGKWIDIRHTFMCKCSECDWINNDDSGYNFCPNCGADMRDDSDE